MKLVYDKVYTLVHNIFALEYWFSTNRLRKFFLSSYILGTARALSSLIVSTILPSHFAVWEPNKDWYYGLDSTPTTVRHLPQHHLGESHHITSAPSNDVDFSSSPLKLTSHWRSFAPLNQGARDSQAICTNRDDERSWTRLRRESGGWGRRLVIGISCSLSCLMRGISAKEIGGCRRLIDKMRSCFVRYFL